MELSFSNLFHRFQEKIRSLFLALFGKPSVQPSESSKEEYDTVIRRCPKIEKLIYLDVDFISLKYEEISGNSPTSKFTKVEGADAGLNITALSAGIHTQESRSFTISSFEMFKEVFQELGRYTTCYSDTDIKNDTTIAWIDGQLQVGIWGDLKPPNYPNFELYFANNTKTMLALLTRDEYFYYGFETLLKLPNALLSNSRFPVASLIRILYCVDDSDRKKIYMATPLIIYEVR